MRSSICKLPEATPTSLGPAVLCQEHIDPRVWGGGYPGLSPLLSLISTVA